RQVGQIVTGLIKSMDVDPEGRLILADFSAAKKFFLLFTQWYMQGPFSTFAAITERHLYNSLLAADPPLTIMELITRTDPAILARLRDEDRRILEIGANRVFVGAAGAFPCVRSGSIESAQMMKLPSSRVAEFRSQVSDKLWEMRKNGTLHHDSLVA